MNKNLLLLSTFFLSAFSYAENWTAWFDRDGPSGSGDYEVISALPAGSVCATPVKIEARYTGPNGLVSITSASSAPNYLSAFSPSVGLVCNNADQVAKGKPACINYQVRFSCATRNDLTDKYPFLKDVDNQNAIYSLNAPGFKGRHDVNPARLAGTAASNGANLKTAADATPPTPATGSTDPVVDNVFHLGQGFDAINTTYRSQCLDQSHPDFKVISTPSTLGSHYSITHVKSHVELYQALDNSMNASATTGFTIEGVDVTAGVSFTNQTIKSSYLDESHEVFVAKYTNAKTRYSLTTQLRPIKDAFVDEMLQPNQVTKQRDFFSECGDRFVDGVELGANMYVVFYYDTKLLKEDKKTQASMDVNLAISTIFQGGLSQSQTTQVSQILNKYQVKFDVYSLGGPDIITTFTDPTQFSAYINTFAAGINDSNVRAIEEFYRDYTLPSKYSTSPYFTVFANTNSLITNAQKYTAVMSEYLARCNRAKEYNQVLGSSFDLKSCSNDSMKPDISQGRRECGESPLWDSCVHPNLHKLYDGSSLMDKLAANTPDFYLTDKLSETREQNVTGGVWNKKCISDAYSICLAAGCHENKPEGNIAQGYQYNEFSYSSPANSGEQGYQNTFMYSDGAARCVKEEIKACTHKIAGSKANFKYSLQLWGVCPTSTAFPLN